MGTLTLDLPDYLDGRCFIYAVAILFKNNTNMEDKPSDPPPTVVVVQGQQQYANHALGISSVNIKCQNCNMDVVSVVDSSIKGMGWAFCLFCGLFPGLLVLCMNGFRKFKHSCPRCNMVIGTHEPPFTSGEKW